MPARKTTTRARTTATSDRRQHGLVAGYRSGLEEKVAEQLRAAGVIADYESIKIRFTPPLKERSYTPDFKLPNGIIVETKGRFLTEDRQKHKYIKAEHPDLDVRFVFSRAATTLSKASKTTYADWCRQYGFAWAEKFIPESWLREPPCPRRLAAIERATRKSR